MLSQFQQLRRYPPKITLEFIKGRDASTCQVGISFSGASEPLEDSIRLLPQEIDATLTHPSPVPTTPVRSTRGDPPTLPELVRLRIPEGIGDNYSRFGILLLNDVTGGYVLSLRNTYMGVAQEAVLRILRQWLEGKGLSVTWESLIQTLRDTDFAVLADEIEARSLSNK